MRLHRQPTIKALMLLMAGWAAYLALFLEASHFARFAHVAVLERNFLVGQGVVLAIWVCFGVSVALTARKRWRVFVECFGMRLATCLASYVICFGPPGLPFWYPPGTNPMTVPSRVPLWVAEPTSQVVRFDAALTSRLNEFVDPQLGLIEVVNFMWFHATVSFLLTSALYGLFMYALARTCRERRAPMTGPLAASGPETPAPNA